MTRISRRDWLKWTAAGAGVAGASMSGWIETLAADAAKHPQRKKAVILLWMNGGPSQTDTFDLKPGHENGGEFKEIDTSVAGLRISEHLPKLAKFGDKLAVMRGLSTKEGDHGRGTFVMRTGRMPDPLVRFPTLGSMVAERLSKDDTALPPFVSVNPFLGFEPAAYEAGFLGPRYAALAIKPRDPQQGSPFAELGVDNLQPTKAVPSARSTARLDLLKDLQTNLVKARPRGAVVTHDTVLQKAIQLMNSEAGQVFDLTKEPPMVREKYGTGIFGQGCLLARRLIEKGVPFVEVSLGNGGEWDTHSDNFNRVQQLSQQLDAGWASLMAELDERGLLDSTTIVWMGEFGRTPVINGSTGRDHYPNAWSAVLAGGGIKGGQAFGRTGADGMQVEDGKIDVGDLIATACAAAGIDPASQNVSDIGRPFKIAEGQPVKAVLRS